jgi:hypothetical protein
MLIKRQRKYDQKKMTAKLDFFEKKESQLPLLWQQWRFYMADVLGLKSFNLKNKVGYPHFLFHYTNSFSIFWIIVNVMIFKKFCHWKNCYELLHFPVLKNFGMTDFFWKSRFWFNMLKEIMLQNKKWVSPTLLSS